MRLTLLHVPAGGRGSDQDQGRHLISTAIAGYAGDWRQGDLPGQASRLNQPLLAFQAQPHEGPLGKRYSAVRLSAPQVFLQAFKRAEGSDEAVVRLQERFGRPADGVEVAFANPVLAAREVNGAEEAMGPATVKEGKLITSLRPFQPRAFALKLGESKTKLAPPQAQPLTLPFDQDVVSTDARKDDGDFDGEGHALPAELFPTSLSFQAIPFQLGSTADGATNAMACKGQILKLPQGNFNRLYLLAAAVDDQEGQFQAGTASIKLAVPHFSGFIGQWDKLETHATKQDPFIPASQAFLKRQTVAWVGTHRHIKNGSKDGSKNGSNEPYVFCYLFKLRLDLPAGTQQVSCPQNEKIKLLVATAAFNENDAIEWAGTPPDGQFP